MTPDRNRLKSESAEPGPCCDIPLHENLSLPMVMVQGWFNDQHDCFQLLLQGLTREEQALLFTKKAHLESVKAKYKQLWDGGGFKAAGVQNRGVHKLLDQLRFSSFAWWATCVHNAVTDADSLAGLLEGIGTVEAAHDTFRRWFSTAKKVRIRYLNAADAARILARYGYLKPEERPLLARGSLRARQYS